MQILTAFVLSAFVVQCSAQSDQPSPNIFIFTTDGFRWQEIFNGADSLIINNPDYVKDTALLKYLYWDNDVNERRKMLMPFVWKTIEKKGSLYGNRIYDNNVSVSNAYRLSYAGYNEILTGYADPSIISNAKKWNNNENLLEFLNTQPAYKNKVAAFCSWNLFEYILNQQKGNIYSNAGYQTLTYDSISSMCKLTNAVQLQIADNQKSTRNDMLTFVAAKEYIQTQHPKVVFIGLGDTDEYAHSSKYDDYLQAAHRFDDYLSQLWYYVNTDPFYKKNTTFIITTDHGRGNNSKSWVRHGPVTNGSRSSWLMTLGNNLEALGEVKHVGEIFNNQLAQTIAQLLGYYFAPAHNTGSPISLAEKKR